MGQTVHKDFVLVQPYTYDDQTLSTTLTSRLVRDGSAESRHHASGVHKLFRLIQKFRSSITELAAIPTSYASESSRVESRDVLEHINKSLVRIAFMVDTAEGVAPTTSISKLESRVTNAHGEIKTR